jgi:hypothetical protein
MKQSTLAADLNNLYETSYATRLSPLVKANDLENKIKPSLSDGTLPNGTENVVIFQNWHRESRMKETELEWWLGKVTELRNDSFIAVLEDLSGKTNIVEFDKNEIDPRDEDLLLLGAKFTYSISSLDKPTGREYITRLAFSARRTWLKEYVSKAKDLADEVLPEDLLNL